METGGLRGGELPECAARRNLSPKSFPRCALDIFNLGWYSVRVKKAEMGTKSAVAAQRGRVLGWKRACRPARSQPPLSRL